MRATATHRIEKEKNPLTSDEGQSVGGLLPSFLVVGLHRVGGVLALREREIITVTESGDKATQPIFLL